MDSRADDAQKPVDPLAVEIEANLKLHAHVGHLNVDAKTLGLLRRAAARLRALSGAVPEPILGNDPCSSCFADVHGCEDRTTPFSTRCTCSCHAAASPVAGVPPEQGGGEVG